MKSQAFTINYEGIAREIITPVSISEPIFESVNKNDSRIKETTALWDTGATNCAITPLTVKAHNLKPISVARVNHAGGSSHVNVYLINIYLPNGVMLPGVRATECDQAAGDFGIIIGMDIITEGDFSLTNINKKTTMTYRFPSMATIDYVEEHNQKQKSLYAKTNRNDKCPCGSGKKYKHCHENKY
jgi:hypothetical protein